MDQEISQEQLQDLWNEEAAKLEADDESPSEELVEETLEADEPADEPPAEDLPAAEPEVEDPLAGMPDIVRAKLAQIDELAAANHQLLQHVRTAEGRVAAMQRDMALAKQAQQSVAQSEAPSDRQIAAASGNLEKWEQLRSDFPEWAEAVEEFVSSQRGAAQHPQGGLTPEQVASYVQQQVQQTRTEMARVIEEAKIEGKHDNWRETVNSPDFASWFAAQPYEVKALADSTAARDAIAMLDLYAQSRARSATEVKQTRGQRLAAAASTRPGQTPPPLSEDSLTAEELWNLEAQKRAKTAAARGFTR